MLIILPPTLSCFKDAEETGKNLLEYLGWDPVKTTPQILGKGVPDFKCSCGRWVEVKRYHPQATFRDGISVEQLFYWYQLLRQGDRVFLLHINRAILANFYEVTALNFNNVAVKLQ